MKILIPDAESGHAIWVSEGLYLNKNNEFHIMSKDSNPALRYSKKCKSFKKIIGVNNEAEYLEEILEYAKKINADILFPIDESLTHIFSKNRDYIQTKFNTIPIPEIKAFTLANNKRELAHFCISKSLPVPETWNLENFQKLILKNNNLKFPFILKPAMGHGGKNIHLIKSQQEFDLIDFEKLDSSFGEYFIQEYIQGYDIDMSILAKDGKIQAYSIQKGIVKRNSEFAASLGIQFLQEEELLSIVEKMIQEINYSGIAHIDLRFDSTKNEFKIIEINCRFWGSVLGSILTGINFPELAIISGLNQTLPKQNNNYQRYFDLISLLNKPKEFYKNKVKLKETNLPFILKDPLAHLLNIYRRNF